jgi:glycosyltransferase involved in cell wall biosynthesis
MSCGLVEPGGVVAFQGSREGRSAFALINARWTRALEAGGYTVVDYPSESRTPDFVIHHDFATQFTEFVPPEAGKCIAVRTWDFGPLPPAWVRKINGEFAQYWAHSRWIAQQARIAGVQPERIRIVPPGIDPLIFRPDGPRFPLPTGKRFRFLFVGGVSLRKGTDILLQAYRRAFTRQDDVCLVLKDHSDDLFYRENQTRDRIGELRKEESAAEVLHLDAFLPEAELAALYRSCDVAVFPYRAEGFCLPILEAMACGVPAIVPGFGACLDFCSEQTSYLARARRIRAPVGRNFRVALGFQELIAEVDFCEVEVDTLIQVLQAVRQASSLERAARAAAGLEIAHSRFTWDQVGSIVLEQLQWLAANPQRA